MAISAKEIYQRESYTDSLQYSRRGGMRFFRVSGLTKNTAEDLQDAAGHVLANYSAFPGDSTLATPIVTAMYADGTSEAIVAAKYPPLQINWFNINAGWHSRTTTKIVKLWFPVDESSPPTHWWDGSLISSNTRPPNGEPLEVGLPEVVAWYDKQLSDNPQHSYESLIGHINDDVFQGAAAGTLLFEGLAVYYDPKSDKYNTRFIFRRRPYKFFTDYVKKVLRDYDWTTYGRKMGYPYGTASFSTLPNPTT